MPKSSPTSLPHLLHQLKSPPPSWPDPTNDAFCPGCSKGTARKCLFPALHYLSSFWVPSRDVAQCLPSECEDQGCNSNIIQKQGAITGLPLSANSSMSLLWSPHSCCPTIPIVHQLSIGFGALQRIHILMFMWEHFLDASFLSCMYTNLKSNCPTLVTCSWGKCQRDRGSLRSVQCPSSKWTQCTALRDFLIDFIFQTWLILSRSLMLPKRMKNKFLVISKQIWVILVIDGLSDV